MGKALFIFPKDSILFGVPLGIATLAACLREAGCGVSILDLRYDSETKLFRQIKNKDYDIIGLYSSSDIANVVCKLASKVKKISPNSTLIVGGPHATLNPGFFLKRGFDLIIKGESERTIVELYSKINNKAKSRVANGKDRKKIFSSIKGIIWKHKGRIVVNEPQPLIEDLDKIPLPAYDLFPNIKETFKVNYTWTNLQPFTHVLTSRGCPYNCYFCQPMLYSMFGSRIRRMSPQRILELLSWLKDKYGIKEVFFEDDLLFHKAWKKWLFDISDLIKKNRLDLRWWGQTRANTSTREMLSKAKSAGCYMVMCGCESGSQKVLDYYNKQIKVSDTKKLFKTCRELGIMTIAEIIFGAPVETMEDAMKTVSLIKKIRPDNVFTTTLTAYPGTYLYEKLEKEKIMFEKDFDKISRATSTKKVHSMLTDSQIQKLQSSIIPPNPSIKYILQRPYYRNTYKLKIKNLVENRELKKLGNLIFLTGFDPLIVKMRPLYRKHKENPLIKGVGKIYRSIRTNS